MSLIDRALNHKTPITRALIAVAAIAAVTAAMTYQERRFYAPFQVPLSPSTGYFQTREFQIPDTQDYRIMIGVGTRRLDGSTCLALTSAPVTAERCRAAAPPLGAVKWKLRQSGRLVDTGSAPAGAWDWARNANEEGTTWRKIGAFNAKSGSHYILELDLEAGSVSIDPYHPSLMIGQPYK